jgi:hypothetical protein
MLANVALDVAPHDPGFQRAVAEVLVRMETFFNRCVSEGQRRGTISSFLPTEELFRHLLGILLGIRVLARVRPDRALREGVVHLPLSFSIRTAAEPLPRIESRGVSAGRSSPTGESCWAPPWHVGRWRGSRRASFPACPKSRSSRAARQPR